MEVRPRGAEMDNGAKAMERKAGDHGARKETQKVGARLGVKRERKGKEKGRIKEEKEKDGTKATERAYMALKGHWNHG